MSASVWKKYRFNQIGNVISGGTPSTTVSEYWNGTIPFVTPNDLSVTTSAIISKTDRNITTLGLSKSSANLLSEGTLIISTRAPIGYLAIAEKECATNQGCKSVSFFSNQDSLFHYYNTQKYIQRMKALGSGTTFAEISKGDLEKIVITFPSDINEQKRIASILSTCDMVIQKTQSTIEKYKAIKQGMMQDLFTRGLTKDGKLRPSFKDAPELYKESELGMIPKEWEVKELNKLNIEIIDGDRGSNYPHEDELYDFGHCLFLSADNVTKNGFVFNKTQYISEYKDNILGNGKLNKRDIVLTTRGTVGNIAYFDNSIKFNHIRINSGMLILRNLDNNLNTDFLDLSFKEYFFNLNYKSLISGSAQPQLPKKDLDKFIFFIPSDIAEQEAISKRISSIDTAIQKEEALLAKYKKIKNGLMNDLLVPPKGATIIDETGDAQ